MLILNIFFLLYSCGSRLLSIIYYFRSTHGRTNSAVYTIIRYEQLEVLTSPPHPSPLPPREGSASSPRKISVKWVTNTAHTNVYAIVVTRRVATARITVFFP